MTETIHVELDRAEGSLQRLIGLVERRGFEIDRFEMGGDGATRSVTLAVRPRDGDRCPQILGRQIDRLIGVRRHTAPVREVVCAT